MNNTEVAQYILKKAGHYTGVIDGDFGGKSLLAAKNYYDFPSDWENGRVAIGILQVYAVRNNIPTGGIDGFWGNNTASAYPKILELLGLESENNVNVSQVIDVKPSYNNWPKQDYASMVRFYGKVGTNQTLLTLPYKMKLAWDLNTSVSRISCHTKVKDSLEKIFAYTLDHYGVDAVKELRLDLFGGCLNVRKMRGGSSWSIHSWGAAVDLDPDRNKLKWGRDKATLARPDYLPFWRIVEAEGWTSLGRSRNYDWMHLQAADL